MAGERGGGYGVTVSGSGASLGLGHGGWINHLHSIVLGRLIIVENFRIWQGEAVELWLALISTTRRRDSFQSELSEDLLEAVVFPVNQQSFVLRAKVLFKHQMSLFLLFLFSVFQSVLPRRGFLRRCGNRTCPSRCGLSSWTRACCGTGPAGCGNNAR